jgi:hypothetical protein
VGVFGGDSILSQLSPFFLAKTGPQPSATIATSAPNPLGCLDGKLSQNTFGITACPNNLSTTVFCDGVTFRPIEDGFRRHLRQDPAPRRSISRTVV